VTFTHHGAARIGALSQRDRQDVIVNRRALGL
jgi:hypothetical protein